MPIYIVLYNTNIYMLIGRQFAYHRSQFQYCYRKGLVSPKLGAEQLQFVGSDLDEQRGRTELIEAGSWWTSSGGISPGKGFVI